MKTLILLLVAQGLLLFSCTPGPERKDEKQDSVNFPRSNANANPNTLTAITPEQQTAFDAFNSIQQKGKHLYSTFPGIHHDCFPPDTSFVISRAELLIAIEGLLAQYYTHISIEQRTRLAAETVLAQEEYLVFQCGYLNGSKDNVVKNLPPSGTWVLPRVLGRRDIVLEW